MLRVRVSSLTGLLLGLGAATIGVNVAGPYIVTAGLIAIALGLSLVRYRLADFAQAWRRFDAVALVFLAWISGTELYNALSLSHAPNYGTILLVIVAYAASWPARMATREAGSFVRFTWYFALPAVPVALVAIAQLARVPGVNEFLLHLVRTSGLEQRLDIGRDIRATSTIGHPTGLGAYLCCIMAMCGAAAILLREQKRSSRGFVLVWSVCFIGQLATVTFATTAVALAIAASIAVRLRVRPGMIASAALVLVVGWLAFGGFISQRLEQQSAGSSLSMPEYAWLPQTIGFRLSMWISETIPAWAHRPLSGWGYGVYEHAQNAWPFWPLELDWVSPESEWFRTLISAGLPALAIEVLLLVALYRTNLKGRAGRHILPVKALYLGLMAACFIHGHLSGPGIIVAFWAAMGAVHDHRLGDR